MYSQATGTTLIQCSDAATGAFSVYIFDRYAKADEYEIEDARYFRPEYLSQLIKEGVPDRFGYVPICSARQTDRPATFLALEKEPTNAEEPPYCYRVYHISTDKGIKVIKDDGTRIRPATKKTAAKWSALRRKLKALIKP